ncbi:hypothetical protein Ancab_017047 [Ancistrocladus abbreviatus]
METATDLDTNLQEKMKKKSKKKKAESLTTMEPIKAELKAKCEPIREHPDKTPPLIGYFPSGFNPHTRNPESDPLPFTVYRNQDKPKRLQLVVSPNGSAVDFVGTNYSGEATVGQMCTYAIGVLDKETKQLKIVPIASNKIFRLEPRVSGSDTSNKDPLTPEKEELTSQKRADKIRDLTQLYGTKSAIKGAEKLWKLKQKEDAEQAINQKLGEGIVDKEALASTSAEVSRNIPPHDLSATTPEKAYPLEKIILKGEWDYLLDIWELLLAGEEIRLDVYPSFICNRVYKLDLIKDESEKKRFACVLSYITHLIKFKERHSVDGFSSTKQHKFPNILFQKFSNMFVDTEKKRLSDDKIGLLISYVLVLTLFVDEFQTDPIDIARDLRMTSMSLRVHFESLGCKFRRKNNVTVATLPVPLEFQTMRKRRRR